MKFNSSSSHSQMTHPALVTCVAFLLMLGIGVSNANADDTASTSGCVEPTFAPTFSPEQTALMPYTEEQISQWRSDVRALAVLSGEVRSGEMSIKFSESSGPEVRCSVKARLGLQFQRFVMYRSDLQDVIAPSADPALLLSLLKQLTYEPSVEHAEVAYYNPVGGFNPPDGKPKLNSAVPTIVGGATAQPKSQVVAKRCKGKKSRTRSCKAAKKRAASRRR